MIQKIMRISPFIIISGFLVTFMACKNINTGNKGQGDSDIVIMAYYVPEKDYQPEKIPVEKLTHIIFSFSEVIDNRMAFVNESSSEKLHKLVNQKERNPDLKVMIACGGWGGCAGFSDMAATPETRGIFVESTIEFINTYKLDGVDIDWEYPGLPGAGNPFRPEEDEDNFTMLMKELREAMDVTGKNLTLTFASAGWEHYYNFVNEEEVMKYADYINVMTYDFVGGGSFFTGHHTNLGKISIEDIKETPFYNYIQERAKDLEEQGLNWAPRGAEAIIPYCIELGINPKQIVIGAAFYGRAWKGVPPENNGLYQSNKGVHTGWAGYSNLRKEYENKNGFIRYWDPVAKAPYLYNETDSIFISYDDTSSVKLKTRYSIDKQLGGIMFWQLGNDTKEENSLLDAIFEESKRF